MSPQVWARLLQILGGFIGLDLGALALLIWIKVRR